MAKKKINHLLEKVIELFSQMERGKVLDLGCGRGHYSGRLSKLGYKVTAADLDAGGFKYKDTIKYKECDISKTLPFDDNSFDYCLLAEVIEHLKNPYAVVKEINRIVKPGGKFVLSTPNILNLRSRFRYLTEGAYDFYREPPLDHLNSKYELIYNLHLVPWRYHDLEYLLFDSGFRVSDISASVCENYYLSFILPIVYFQLKSKEICSKKKSVIDYSRINSILLSKELLFGRHLIVTSEKNIFQNKIIT